MSNVHQLNTDKAKKHRIELYATPAHTCSYFADKKAITVYLDPYYPKNSHLYSFLTEKGFRRSGEFLYRPDCPSCQQCISVRIDVAHFKARRTQRRIIKKNQDLIITKTPPVFRQEHFDLYHKYISTRHSGTSMDNPTEAEYEDFLCNQWSQGSFYEFRLYDKLIAVAVIDPLKHGLSAIYTYFDPDYASRSLGAFAILWQVEEARRLGLPWVYLGYWIKDCSKMTYKTDYQPLEYFYQQQWHSQPPTQT